MKRTINILLVLAAVAFLVWWNWPPRRESAVDKDALENLKGRAFTPPPAVPGFSSLTSRPDAALLAPGIERKLGNGNPPGTEPGRLGPQSSPPAFPASQPTLPGP